MKMLLSLLLLCLFLTGCSPFASWGNKTDTITLPSGEVYVANVTTGGFFRLTTENGIIIEVDHRGRPGFIEQVFGAVLVKMPDALDQ